MKKLENKNFQKKTQKNSVLGVAVNKNGPFL